MSLTVATAHPTAAAAGPAEPVRECREPALSPAAPGIARIQTDGIILSVCKFLPLAGLSGAPAVSKQWNRVISHDSFWRHLDPKGLFPKLCVIDETTWRTCIDVEAYGLDVTGAPPIDKCTIQGLKKMSAIQVEGDAGITLFILPKGLTLNKVAVFAITPKQGNAACFSEISPSILKVHGDTRVERTCRMAMTNSVVIDTRTLPASDQQKRIERLECQLPGILPAATLPIMAYVSSPAASPTRLYGDIPVTYTRCRPEGQVKKGNSVAVGGFGPGGPMVVRAPLAELCMGAGALLEF